MMTIQNLLVILVLLLGLQKLSATLADACMEDFKRNKQNGMDNCPATTNLIKCVMKGSNNLSEIDDKMLSNIKEIFDNAMRKTGFSCDIDYKKILEELREEYNTGLSTTTSKSKGLEEKNKSYIDVCVEKFTDNLGNGMDMCLATTNYIKCVIRGRNKLSEIDDDMLSYIKTIFDNSMRKIGVSCDIDYKKIVEELREEYNTGLTTTNSKPKGLEEKNKSYMDVCVEKFTDNLGNGMDMCLATINYIKCVIRGRNKLSEIDDDMLSYIKTVFDNSMRKRGVSCDIDYKKIVEELREEYNTGLTTTNSKPEGLEEKNTSFIVVCGEKLAGNLKNGMDRCLARRTFIKCFMKGSDLYKPSENHDDMLSHIKTAFDNSMRKIGLSCNIDYKKIVEELREENPSGLSTTTKKPKGLEEKNKSYIDVCVEKFTDNLGNGMDMCLATTNYIKCVIRGRNKLSEIDDDTLSYIKTIFDNSMRKISVSCDIDYKKIVEELREEYNTGLTTTTSKPRGYHYATTFTECTDIFTVDVKGGTPSCNQITPFLKCVFRVRKYYKRKTISYDEIRQFTNTELSKLDVHCDIDVRELIEELREEMKDDNGSGFIGGPYQLIALLIFTVFSLYFAHY